MNAITSTGGGVRPGPAVTLQAAQAAGDRIMH